MNVVRILIADDHKLVRSGFRALLEQMDDVTVVGEARDGREAVELVDVHRPDIVIMDIAMPELNGLEATERIRRRFSSVKVLLLTMHKGDEYVSAALDAGAAGYMLKDSGEEEFAIAIGSVAEGGTYISPAITKRIVDGHIRVGDGDELERSRLTLRQREVLQLLAEGHSTKAIARKLEISPKTVESHRAQLMARLDIHDVPGLVKYAIRTGLVSPA